MISKRFPIKTCPWLLVSILLGYLTLILVSVKIILATWALMIAWLVVFISAYLFYRDYMAVIQQDEELCWSGSNWLLDRGSGKQAYLELDHSSWVTPYFCFLRFRDAGRHKSWIFCPSGLGERLYRDLCYQIKQQIISEQQNSANNQ